MLEIRRAADRGRTTMDWLDSRHTFSFADYYDPAHMGFGALRVINEDRVQPARGFGAHGHRDMEIISYVLSGALQHRDSMGNGSTIRPDDVQIMSAGTGVRHSEFNHSATDPVHFLQIWILPEREGLAPSYQQKTFSASSKAERLCLLASRTGRDDSVAIRQDVDLYASVLGKGETVTHQPTAGRKVWIQVARGRLDIEGRALSAGDGVAIEGLSSIVLAGASDAEVLVFDMASQA